MLTEPSYWTFTHSKSKLNAYKTSLNHTPSIHSLTKTYLYLSNPVYIQENLKLTLEVTLDLPGLVAPYRLIRKQQSSHSWTRRSNSRLLAGSSGEHLNSVIFPSADVLVNIYFGLGGGVQKSSVHGKLQIIDMTVEIHSILMY